MNLLLKNGTDMRASIESVIGRFQQYLPDVKSLGAEYAQFEGCVKSNGVFDRIIVGDNHYKIEQEFYNRNAGIMFEFFRSHSYPLII